MECQEYLIVWYIASMILECRLTCFASWVISPDSRWEQHCRCFPLVYTCPLVVFSVSGPLSALHRNTHTQWERRNSSQMEMFQQDSISAFATALSRAQSWTHRHKQMCENKVTSLLGLSYHLLIFLSVFLGFFLRLCGKIPTHRYTMTVNRRIHYCLWEKTFQNTLHLELLYYSLSTVLHGI